MKKFLIIFIFAVFLATGLFGDAKAVNQPDLTISSVSFTDEYLTLKIRNSGTVRFQGNFKFTFRWMNEGKRDYRGSSFETDYLSSSSISSNGETIFTFSKNSADSGANVPYFNGLWENVPEDAVWLETVFDALGSVEDANIRDNFAYVPRFLPDLTGSATFTNDRLDLKIRNIGIAPFQGNLKFRFRWMNEGRRQYLSDSFETDWLRSSSIPVNRETIFTFPKNTSDSLYLTELWENVPEQAIHLETVFESLSSVPEIHTFYSSGSENNNGFYTTRFLPDLTIGSAYFTNDRLILKIRNVGAAPFRGYPKFTFRWMDESNNRSLGYFDSDYLSFSSIPAGGETIFIFPKNTSDSLYLTELWENVPEQAAILEITFDTLSPDPEVLTFFGEGANNGIDISRTATSSSSTATSTAAATSTGTTATSTAYFDKIKESKTIKYPIKELGNCKDKDDCKKFCDIKKNTKKCLNWAKDNGFMTEEETVVAEEIVETTNGPGNCTTKESCAEFCEKPANIAACLNYAEKNNWLTADELSKARKVAKILEKGEATPGKCSTPGGCKDYCSDNSHAVECVAFGKTAGLLSAEEAAEAEKIAPLMQQGRMPGGGKMREETEAYCDKKENRAECDKFFEAAGVKKGGSSAEDAENVPSIFKASGTDGPGGCKTKAECDAYCDSHPGECDEQVKQAGGEVKEVTVPCSTNEECRKFCADSTNSEACKNIVIEESPEEAEASKPEVILAEIEKLRQNILEMPVQSQECLKQVWGVESFDRVMAGQAPETPVKAEDLQSCYSQGVQKAGEEAAKKPEGQEQRDAEQQMNNPSLLENLQGNLLQNLRQAREGLTSFLENIFSRFQR